MDILDLERKLGIENMSADEQMALLTALQKSAEEKAAKARNETIGKSAELVIQGLKRIKTDLESRFADLNSSIQDRASNLRNGIDGKDGRDGKDGKSGRDGLKGDKGDAGRDGRDGVDGADGVSVTDARIDFDGSLIIVLSTGRELNVGEVVAPDLAERIKVITNGGGTSQSVLDTLASLQTQINNLIPSQSGNSGKYLTTNGSTLSWGSAVGGLSYQGTWNASTNSPTLTSSVGTNGYYYVVDTAGSTNLNGITDWKAGDWLIFNGSTWQKIDQSWAIAGANDNITSMTGVTGGISSPDFIQFDTAATVTNATGKLYWDSTQATLTVGLTADIAADVGQTLYAYVTNAESVTINKGQPVYMFGAQGDRMTVKLAYNTGDATSAKTVGICAENIGANQTGLILCQGVQDGLNLGSYTAGDTLYLGATAGTLTATKPYAPNHLVYIGVVERANNGNGRLYVRVQNGYEMDELHNVSAQNPTNGQVLIYNESTSLWEKHTLTDGTGISITEGAGTITVGLASGYGDTLNPYASKTANYVLAAPNGSAGAPTFRAVVAADIPTLNQNTTGTASNVTGTVAIANGGSGQTTAQLAINAFAGAVTSGSYLRGNGTNVVMSAIQAADVPTLNQNTTGTAASTPKLLTTNFTIEESGGKLLFKYGATTIASMSSTGIITSATNIVANGTP